MNGGIRVFLTAVFIVIIAFAFNGCSDSEKDGGGEQTEWTVLFYGAGNNAFDDIAGGLSSVVSNVQSLEKVGSSDQVKVIAMVSADRIGNAAGASYYFIEYHPDDEDLTISSTELEDLGQVDMSDWMTLRSFLVYGMNNYPSDKYALIIDDYGFGWPGACLDEIAGGSEYMTTVGIADAMTDAIEMTETDGFDVVVFHCRLMSMIEVAYELRNGADFMVASETLTEMDAVLGGEDWLDYLTSSPNASGAQLAQQIAADMSDAAVAKMEDVHIAAVDLSKVARISEKMNALADSLTPTGYWNEIYFSWEDSWSPDYDDSAYVDIGEFAENLKLQENLGAMNNVTNAADSVIDAIDEAVIVNSAGYPDLNRTGLTVHLPWHPDWFDSSYYADLDFAGTGWITFISDYISGIWETDSVTITGTITYPGNILAHPYLILLDQDNNIIIAWTVAGGSESAEFLARFTVEEAPESYIVAVDDLDGDMIVFEDNEPFGCYDADEDGLCDYNQYEVGQIIDNILIELYLSAGAINKKAPLDTGIDITPYLRDR